MNKVRIGLLVAVAAGFIAPTLAAAQDQGGERQFRGGGDRGQRGAPPQVQDRRTMTPPAAAPAAPAPPQAPRQDFGERGGRGEGARFGDTPGGRRWDGARAVQRQADAQGQAQAQAQAQAGRRPGQDNQAGRFGQPDGRATGTYGRDAGDRARADFNRDGDRRGFGGPDRRTDDARRDGRDPRNGDDRRAFQGRPDGARFDGARVDGARQDNSRFQGADPRREYRGDDRRYDNRRDNDRRYDDRRSGDQAGRGDPRGRDFGRPGDNRGAWRNDWRSDRRYDWQGYRNQNRRLFQAPRYVAPRGYGFGYRPFSRGYRLEPFLFAQNYWIGDPWDYRLPPVYGPYRWVRYYNDVLLVDIDTGEVIDVIRNFFW